jgi:hypothetical protein
VAQDDTQITSGKAIVVFSTLPTNFLIIGRFPTRKDSESASLMSVESASSLTQGTRNPSSMPVPSVPRRAAPPRKKTSKTPSLPSDVTPEAPEPVAEPSQEQPGAAHVLPVEGEKEVEEGEKEPEQVAVGDDEASTIPQEVDRSHEKHSEIAEVLVTEPHQSDGPLVDEQSTVIASDPSIESSPLHEEKHNEESPVIAHDPAESEPYPSSHDEIPASSEPEATADDPAEEAQFEPEEEDEVSRRKRVAERLTKMGAFNPFGPPPKRQASVPSTPELSREASAVSEEQDDVSGSPAIPERPNVRQSSDATPSSNVDPPSALLTQVLVAPSQTSQEEVQPLEGKDSVDSDGSDYGGEGSENGK